MTLPEYFTVLGDFRSVVADLSTDIDHDPQIGPVTATVTFKPVLRDGDAILATNATPRPTGYVAAPIVARINSTGQLVLRDVPDGTRQIVDDITDLPATGDVAKYYVADDTDIHYRWNGAHYDEIPPYAPVRLLANTALLELESPLYYTVSFSSVLFNGRAGKLNSFTFEAPTSDIPGGVNLIEVMRQPGQPAVGITKIAPGAVRAEDGNLIFSFGGVDLDEPVPYLDVDVTLDAADISDGTATGRALITAASAAAARTAIGVRQISVLDYIPNPADTSTHTAGFQAAINAAVAGDGDEIVIPAGKWYVEGLSIPTKASLKFRGAGATAFPYASGDNAGLTTGTQLIRTGNTPIFSAVGPESSSAGDVYLSTVSVFFGYIRDLLIEDVALVNANANATTPLMDMKACSGGNFHRVVWYSPEGSSLLDMQSVFDTRFTDCFFVGGGKNSTGLGAVRILGQTITGATSRPPSKELQFVNCHFESYYGTGIQIGDAASTALKPQLLLFSNIKMESLYCTGPHVTVCANAVYVNNFYITHAFNTGPVLDIQKCFGFYGSIGFVQSFATGWVDPSCRVNVSANAFTIDLDVQLVVGPASTVNVVTQASTSDESVNIRISGISQDFNGTTRFRQVNRTSNVLQRVASDAAAPTYIFAKDGLNSWTLGNVANTFGDAQAFDIRASDANGAVQVFALFRSYTHSSGTNPTTASIRELNLIGCFLNLSSATHGFVHFATQSGTPTAPTAAAAGIQLYSATNASRPQLSLSVGGSQSLIETRGITTIASTSTLTVNSNATNHATVSALAGSLTIAAPTGTPTSGQQLVIAIEDNGTARALTWNAAWQGLGLTLPTTTTPGVWLVARASWSAEESKWLVHFVSTGLPATSISDSTATGRSVLTAADAAAARTAIGVSTISEVDVPSDLTSGQATFNRWLINGFPAPGTGNLRLTYFTARKSETVASFRTIVTTLATTVTLSRIGLYTVDSNGDLTLVASTANNVDMWRAAGGSITQALTTPYAVTRGVRYAVGLLIVNSGTACTISGNANVGSAEAAIAPRLSGFVASQTDLPSTVAAGSVSNSGAAFYTALVPS
jgi:hypothetical protein